MFSAVSFSRADITAVFHRAWVDSVEVVCYKHSSTYIIALAEIFKRLVNKVMTEICCIPV